MLLTERNHDDPEVLDEAREQRPCIEAHAHAERDARFHQGGRADRRRGGVRDRVDQAFVTGLLGEYRDERRAVEDHAPSRP